jgi:hypothetical protein
MTLPRRMRLRYGNQGSFPQDAFATSQHLSTSVLSQSRQPRLLENVCLVFCWIRSGGVSIESNEPPTYTTNGIPSSSSQ